jgi:hypothetical protein
MPEQWEFDLRNQLRGIGIVTIEDQDRVFDVARKCSKTGVVLGTSWAILGAPAFAPGALTGFLSGFLTGTVSCMGLSYSAQEVIKRIGRGDIPSP